MTETIATVNDEPQFGDWWAASEADIPHCVWGRRMSDVWFGACRQQFVPRIRVALWQFVPSIRVALGKSIAQVPACEACLDRLAELHVPAPTGGCDPTCDWCKRRRRLGLSLISYSYP